VSAPKCGGITTATSPSTGGTHHDVRVRRPPREIDWRARKVLAYLTLPDGGIPQDIRVSPDGTIFYVAD